MNFTDDISSTQFEELCYDLLGELGFSDISWRKGTDLEASPADQGRDIEALLYRKDIDSINIIEKWFVECKHYKKGIPPTALQGALAWAEAESPDTLLIAASGFLSNPTKEYLAKYQETRKPRFRIRTWESKDFERMLLGRPRLLHKLSLAPQFPYQEILHPAHRHFIRNPPINTVEYFLSITDALEPRERNDWLLGAYLYVINPQMEEPTSGDQVLGEISKKPITYHEFKAALRRVRYEVSELLLVHGIVSHTLSSLLTQGDTTALQEYLDNHKGMIEFFREQISKGEFDRAMLQSCIRFSEQKMDTLAEDLKNGYKRYCGFCEKVLVPLFDERIDIPEPIIAKILKKS